MQEEFPMNVLKIYFNLILFCLVYLKKNLRIFFQICKKKNIFWNKECDTKSLDNKSYLHNVFNKPYLLIIWNLSLLKEKERTCLFEQVISLLTFFLFKTD